MNCQNWKQVSEKIFEFVKNPKDFLIISAPPGIGKTYLCSALFSFFFMRGVDVYPVKEADLMQKLRSGIKEGREYHFQLKYICDHYLFMLDDFGSTRITEWSQDILFALVDERYSGNRATIITTNVEPKRFHEFVGDRGADRLLAKENTIISILPEQCKSYRTVLD